MRIKENEQLNVLATASGKTANQVSNIIVTELLKNRIIDDSPGNWGETINDSIKWDLSLNEIIQVLKGIGLPIIKSSHYDAFIECVLIGDGECMQCGGDMELVAGDSKRAGGDGYNTPIEYTPIWEEKRCMYCGYNMVSIE